jgi:hypothetical protein
LQAQALSANGDADWKIEIHIKINKYVRYKFNKCPACPILFLFVKLQIRQNLFCNRQTIEMSILDQRIRKIVRLLDIQLRTQAVGH